MTEYCICGHKISKHTSFAVLSTSSSAQYCSECFHSKNFIPGHWVHPFKLDNLKLIEDLAKQKNLI